MNYTFLFNYIPRYYRLDVRPSERDANPPLMDIELHPRRDIHFRLTKYHAQHAYCTKCVVCLGFVLVSLWRPTSIFNLGLCCVRILHVSSTQKSQFMQMHHIAYTRSRVVQPASRANYIFVHRY